ncbi:MAG TPA: UDP-N-acetylmuramate dehydrogenase, partial [Naasia sp.]
MTDARTASARTLLADLTTLRVGGPAERLLAPETPDDLVRTALEVWGDGEPWLVLGGGSNLLVADEGFEGTVLRTATRGIVELPARSRGRIRLRVEAGEDWDGLVAHTVARGLAGMEALSGIPGATGAAPIQNIGAYGQDASDTLVAVDFLDYLTGELLRIPAAELGLGYRTSVFKRGRQGIVTAVEFELEQTGTGPDAPSGPIRYSQLASTLGVPAGERATLGAVRDAVLRLRRSKGMVVDPADPDS